MALFGNYIIKIGLELEFYSTKTLEYLQQFIDKEFLLIKVVKEEQENSQYEIVTDPTDNLKLLVDEINTFKKISKEINDFRAKPFLDKPGNALHIHISLHNNVSNENILNIEPKTKLFIIGGLCTRIKSSMIYFAPFIESYKRFQYYDKFTPRFITWGFENNKTNAIRVTKNTIEHRVPCADSNIDDVLTSILKGIDYGIKNQIMPSEPTFYEPKYSNNFKNRIPLSYHEAEKYS
jgi:glutamine synthetase